MIIIIVWLNKSLRVVILGPDAEQNKEHRNKTSKNEA